jgi:UDP-N-acetylmuramoyl-tripeptide--D-alanyl-D-alanine ligase
MLLDATTLRRWLGPRIRDLPALADGATGVRFHSDRVRPGDAFFALQGARAHGERFADDALARGAAFVVSDRPRPGAVLVDDAGAALLDLGRAARAARRGPVIGVTGSVGKTTTKALLAAALDAAVSPGNLNTPHALATVLVDAWLAGDVDRPLVLELGIDRVGEMAQLLELVRPTDGLLTAVAPAHLASLRDLETIAREKGQLLAAATGARVASASAWARLPDALRAGVARYALTDPRAADGAAPTVGADQDVAWVGVHVAGDDRDRLRATRLAPDGAREAVDVDLPGLGRALAENALGALAVAVALGADPEAAAARIARAPLETGRLTRHRVGGWWVLDDAYNASPASLTEALDVLARAPKPHAAVLGAMLELGAASDAHHAAAGRACADRGLDPVWTVGAAARPLADACPGARHLEDVAAAIAAADALPRRGTLLVKGSRGIGLEALVAHLVRAPEAAR